MLSIFDADGYDNNIVDINFFFVWLIQEEGNYGTWYVQTAQLTVI